jgi:hypothetical protein
VKRLQAVADATKRFPNDPEKRRMILWLHDATNLVENVTGTLRPEVRELVQARLLGIAAEALMLDSCLDIGTELAAALQEHNDETNRLRELALATIKP